MDDQVPGGTGGGDERIDAGYALVIDDDADTRLIEVSILRQAGWKVAEGCGGRHGVALAAQIRPDVIVCDLGMGDLGGLDVIAALGAEPSTAAIPVIVVTATVDGDELVRVIDAGAHDCLIKPLRPVEFIVRCRAALRVSRQHRLLAASERELRMLADNTSEMVVRCSTDGVIRYASPSTTRLLGWSPDELIGRVADELTHPDDLPRRSEPDSAGEPVAEVRRIRRKDGSYIWIESVEQVVAGPVEGEEELLSSARDVTRRVADQGAIASSEQRWREAFDAAPVGMAQVRPDGRFDRVNPALCELLGYSAEALCAMTPAELSDSSDASPGIRPIDGDVGAKQGAQRSERPFRHADGHTVWVLVSAVPIFDLDGQLDYFLGHYLDVTDRRALEARLQHQATHDSLTALPNRTLLHDRLESALRRAEQVHAPLAVLFVDLDDFKDVNDTFGHDAGDELLIHVGGRLQGAMRAGDMVARIGGDEFVVLSSTASAADAGVLADRIRGVMAEPFRLRTQTLHVQASVGVAVSEPGKTAEEMIREADVSMYRVKAGRARS